MSYTNKKAAANHAELAHVWAQQNRDALASGPFHFRGPCLFSYSTAVALFTDHKDGDGATVVLFTRHSWSTTTASKHLSPARDALRGLNVRVIVVDTVPEALAHFSTEEHARNMAEMLARRDALVTRSATARDNAAVYLDDAARLQSDAHTYARAFNLPAPPVLDVSAELLSEARARAATAAAAKREANKGKRATQENRWRAGERVSVPEGGVTMLRLVDDGRTIETSRGARVPVDVAAKLAPHIFRMRRASRSWAPQIPFPVGHYTLNEIRADGALVIGCHVLEFAEVSAMLSRLGLSLDDAAGVRA